jgi:hypothetical protein
VPRKTPPKGVKGIASSGFPARPTLVAGHLASSHVLGLNGQLRLVIDKWQAQMAKKCNLILQIHRSRDSFHRYLIELKGKFLLARLLHISWQLNSLTGEPTMRTSIFLASTILATVLAASAASAAPITFTWDPSATSPTALSTAGAFSPLFTASNMNIADYATINLANPNAVTESGVLAVTSFTGGTVTHGLVNGTGAGAGGAIGGASPYQLYFVFSSVSQLSPDGSGGQKGQFTSLNYTLFGDTGGLCTFSVGGANCTGSGAQLALATGTLSNLGLNSVTINNAGIPSANVAVSITAGADAGGFFVNPSNLSLFDFSAAFTNTPDVVTASGTTITIDGGGGNVDLIRVPEPITLSIFGAGLAGAAAMRRRKAKKA